MYDILQLNEMPVPELKDVAGKLKINHSDKLSKQDLIYKILDQQALHPELVGGGNKHTNNTSTMAKEKAKGEAEEAPKKRGRKKKIETENEIFLPASEEKKPEPAKEPVKEPTREPAKEPVAAKEPQPSSGGSIYTADLSRGNQNKMSYPPVSKTVVEVYK